MKLYAVVCEIILDAKDEHEARELVRDFMRGKRLHSFNFRIREIVEDENYDSLRELREVQKRYAR